MGMIPTASIPGAAILAAESAVFETMIEHGPDGHTDGHDKIARAALEAAAPSIRAQALEDAAAIAARPENKWWAEGQHRAKWLRNLAAAERGSE